MVDSRLAFDIMARDDGATAVLAKVERALDKTGVAAKKNSKISDDAAKASANLTKAHNAETDALDKVQVAEARLADVRSNSKAKTGQVVAAEKALAKARRDAAVAGDTAQKAAKDLGSALDVEGKKAGKGLGSGLKKWFTGDGKSVFKQVGQDGGTVFGSGIAGALKTPVLGPAIIAGVGGAVATALPVVGAIAAAGIVTGFGVGLGALGIVFAAKSVAVKNSWNRTLWSMAADMKVLSKPFEATLLSMSGVARRTFATFKPQLDTAFKTLAPSFTLFGDQLGKALGRLAPALGPLSDAAAAALKSLGGALPDLIGNLSNQLINLSNSVSRNPDGLRDMTSALISVTDGTLKTISVLNDLDSVLKKIPGGFSVFTGLPGKLSPVKGSFDAIFTSISKVDDLLAGSTVNSQQLADIVGKSGAAVSAYGQAAAAAAGGLDKQAGAAARSAHETHAANAAALLLAGAYDRQAAATQNAINALNRMSDKLLSLSGAQIAYQQAVADTTAAIKANGHTHDLLTQKGRDNQTQLDTLTQSVKTQRDAMMSANDGNLKAAKFAEIGRAAYARFAVQMGYSKTQAAAMATQLIALPAVKRVDVQANITDLQGKLAKAEAALKSPHLTATKKAKLEATISNLTSGIATSKALLASLPQSRTAKLLANKADLEAKIKSAQALLASPKLSATKKATLTANIANAKSGIATINGMLARLPGSKSTTITTNVVTKYTTIGSRSSGSGSGGGHINPDARASGGPVSKGVPYIVGEKRPELFVPDQNGTIIPKVPSMAMGSSVAQGLAGGIKGGTSSAISAAADMANAVIASANRVLGISSPSKKFTQIALYIAQGFNRGIRGSTTSIQSAMSSLMSKVVGIGYSSAKQGRILRMLQMENKALQAATIARAKVATALKAAQAKLAAAIQVRNEFRQQITDAALSFNAITNIQPGDGKTLIGRDILESMQNTLAKTKAFATNLANLKKLGLRSDLYKQIAEAGVDAGGATAQALLQGGKGTVAAANDLQRQIANASAGLGNTATDNMYKAGVDAAQGLVNGLLAKTKALNAAAVKLANQIVAQIRKTLGIHSPSRVLEWHGSMAGQGFARGIEGEYGLVAKASAGMGNAARRVGAGRTAVPNGRGVRPASGSPMTVILKVETGGGRADQWLAEMIRRYVQVSAGGDVQKAFGT